MVACETEWAGEEVGEVGVQGRRALASVLSRRNLVDFKKKVETGRVPETLRSRDVKGLRYILRRGGTGGQDTIK